MMGGNQECYPSPSLGGIDVRRATLTERLKDRKASLEKQLAEVTAAVDALDKNPELQTLLDIVSRVC